MSWTSSLRSRIASKYLEICIGGISNLIEPPALLYVFYSVLFSSHFCSSS